MFYVHMSLAETHKNCEISILQIHQHHDILWTFSTFYVIRLFNSGISHF